MLKYRGGIWVSAYRRANPRNNGLPHPFRRNIPRLKLPGGGGGGGLVIIDKPWSSHRPQIISAPFHSPITRLIVAMAMYVRNVACLSKPSSKKRLVKRAQTRAHTRTPVSSFESQFHEEVFFFSPLFSFFICFKISSRDLRTRRENVVNNKSN